MRVDVNACSGLQCGKSEPWNIPPVLASLSLDMTFTMRSPPLFNSPMKESQCQKKKVLQFHPTAVLISFISHRVQESESLYGRCYVSFTQTCHVLPGDG